MTIKVVNKTKEIVIRRCCMISVSYTHLDVYKRQVHDGARYIDRQAAAVHRNLGLVVAAHVRDGLCAGDLARLQILHEQTAHRVGPQRAIEEVARADSVDLDVVRAQLQRERQMCIRDRYRIGRSSHADFLTMLRACVNVSKLFLPW